MRCRRESATSQARRGDPIATATPATTRGCPGKVNFVTSTSFWRA
jgi:hypothetical protein